MSKKIALILSGCGRADGSEIQEATACIFALSKRNISFDAFSLNQNQYHVINHNNSTEQNEIRNMKIESSRITRKEVFDLENIKVDDYQGLVFPGGYGVAKNFSDFAFKGKDFKVNPLLEKVIKEFNTKNIPIASCCISPLILSYILGKKNNGPGIKVTLGDDKDKIKWSFYETIKIANEFGNDIIPTEEKCVVDRKNKIVTSPAYMNKYATSYEVFEGIDLMIEEFSTMI